MKNSAEYQPSVVRQLRELVKVKWIEDDIKELINNLLKILTAEYSSFFMDMMDQPEIKELVHRKWRSERVEENDENINEKMFDKNFKEIHQKRMMNFPWESAKNQDRY